MSVTHLRLGAVGREVAIERVGRRLLRRIGLRGGRREGLRDAAFQAHFPHRVGHRVAASRLQIVALGPVRWAILWLP